MRKVGLYLSALLALIVVLCPAFAAGQQIEPGSGEAAVFSALPKESRDRIVADNSDSYAAGLNRRLSAAEDRAKEAQIDATAAKASADRARSTANEAERSINAANQRINCLSEQVRDPKSGLIKQVTDLNKDIRDPKTGLVVRIVTIEEGINNQNTGLAAAHNKAATAQTGVDTVSGFMRTGQNDNPKEFGWLRNLYESARNALDGYSVLSLWLWIVGLMSVLNFCLGLWNMFHTRPTTPPPPTTPITPRTPATGGTVPATPIVTPVPPTRVVVTPPTPAAGVTP